MIAGWLAASFFDVALLRILLSNHFAMSSGSPCKVESGSSPSRSNTEGVEPESLQLPVAKARRVDTEHGGNSFTALSSSEVAVVSLGDMPG